VCVCVCVRRAVFIDCFSVWFFSRYKQNDIQANARTVMQALAANGERLLIVFDDILTADEIIRTSMKTNDMLINTRSNRKITFRSCFRTVSYQTAIERISATSTIGQTFRECRIDSID
jgi:hypothetical protein